MSTLVFEGLESRQRPLLSAKSCQDLHRITINSDICCDSNSNTEDIHSALSLFDVDHAVGKYMDVFNGSGHLPGEYHIHVDKNIQPVQHAPRRVPVALNSQLQEVIADLEKNEIITKVTEPRTSSKPSNCQNTK